MKIKAQTVTTKTYSIEGMTVEEASAVALLLGKAERGLSTTTYGIYQELFQCLYDNDINPYNVAKE